PADVKGSVEITAKLRYRKFDYKYMAYVHKDKPVPKLPIVDMCADKVVLPVESGADVPPQESPIQPAWQRWNDYGIACYLEAGAGAKRGQTKQAVAAFKTLLTLDVKDANPHAHINLARIYIDDGRLNAAAAELEKARQYGPEKFWWKLAWFAARVNSENDRDLEAAIADLKKIADPANRDPDNNRDFTRDAVVLNRLANIQFKKADGELGDARRGLFLEAIETCDRVLAIDSEDVATHNRLFQCYAAIGRRPRYDGPLPAAGADALNAIAARVASADRAKAARAGEAGKLTKALGALRAVTGDVSPPRVPTIRALLVRLRDAFKAATDREVQDALAAALAALHQSAHEIYKVDEN